MIKPLLGVFQKVQDLDIYSLVCFTTIKVAISLEPHVKNLHLTLAYQFPSNVYQNLADLVEQIDTSYANSWELRLYSRDPRLATKQVHKVIYSHSSREHDELELRVGDYVYINGDAIQNSIDGWVEGISCNGNVGFLPLNHTERTSETNVWTLNATVPLCQASDNKEISTDAIDGVVQSHILREDFYINENRFSQTSKMDESVTSNLTRRGRRRILILRHGERVDFAFGNTWTQFSFNDSQNYVRMDLNMPETLPPRVTEDWEKDSPLTTIGSFQCHQVGQSLKNFGVNFSKVYVSPSYRCVQTANEVLSAMDAYDVPLNVEYGLFEWCLWYELGLPQFLTEKELAVIFNINEEYIPFMKKDDLEEILKESLEDFYSRSLSTMRKILSNSEDGDILIVAHAISIETLSRELVGKEQRSRAELRNLLMRIPYLATVAITETDDHSYQFIEPPCLTLTHNSCSKFDWRILDDN
ncbi:ecdysteroid-phosphate phosphatase isoform X3 [Chironomus tepperi]|uniref:ecdysteroid-phosphate phosphatase isoform X3 n=1 Tax=Chironomus tepperi TaxID=113505 RepID=UPI00391F4BAF